MSHFVHLDRVEIEHVDELSELLDDHHFVRFGSSGVIWAQELVLFVIVVLGNDRVQHVEDLVGMALPLEECEEHFFENFG